MKVVGSSPAPGSILRMEMRSNIVDGPEFESSFNSLVNVGKMVSTGPHPPGVDIYGDMMIPPTIDHNLPVETEIGMTTDFRPDGTPYLRPFIKHSQGDLVEYSYDEL